MLYSGLAFSPDGKHVYASMASLTDPVGDGKANTGNGIVEYGFAEGRITPGRLIPIPLQHLAGGRRTKLIGGVDGAMGVPFPAAIAVVEPGPSVGGELLVADNLSDDALLVMTATGKVVKRFDLSESDAVPSTYPVALAIKGRLARLRGVVERERGGGARSEEGNARSEIGIVEAQRSGQAGKPSVRAGDFAGWEARCMWRC